MLYEYGNANHPGKIVEKTSNHTLNNLHISFKIQLTKVKVSWSVDLIIQLFYLSSLAKYILSCLVLKNIEIR